jgi:hypothetical protein
MYSNLSGYCSSIGNQWLETRGVSSNVAVLAAYIEYVIADDR